MRHFHWGVAHFCVQTNFPGMVYAGVCADTKAHDLFSRLAGTRPTHWVGAPAVPRYKAVEVGFVLSHPSRKDNDPARMGHPG